MAALSNAVLLLANEETFVDKKLLYVAGGCLILTALVFSFLGARSEKFPSPNQLKFVLGLTGALVLLTGFGALQTSRFEQAERRAQNEEAAKDSEAQDVANQQSLDESSGGEASDPNSGTGSTPGSSNSGAPGGGVDQQGESQSSTGASGTATADVEAGRTLFQDTGCGGCHTLADAGTTGQVGPVLDDFVPDMTDDEVRTSITDPGAVVEDGFPDGTMPTTYGNELNETEIDTLVAYLTTVAGQ
jgi:cytochrome c553